MSAAVQTAFAVIALIGLFPIWHFFRQREKSPEQREFERREIEDARIPGDW